MFREAYQAVVDGHHPDPLQGTSSYRPVDDDLRFQPENVMGQASIILLDYSDSLPNRGKHRGE
jgi:hypothetical protein